MASVPERYLLQALEFEGLLRARLHRYTDNQSDIEELLQETYARLLVAGGEPGSDIRNVRAFALIVAQNVALDWARHRNITPIDLVANMEALDVMDEGAEVEEIVNADQELNLLAEGVRQLSTRCRQVFTLRKVYGYSQKEIADRLGVTKNTVNNQLTKAVSRCADALFNPQPPGSDESSFSRLRRALFRKEADK